MNFYTTVSVFICLAVSIFCQPSHIYNKSGRRDKGAEFTDKVKGKQFSNSCTCNFKFVSPTSSSLWNICCEWSVMQYTFTTETRL